MLSLLSPQVRHRVRAWTAIVLLAAAGVFGAGPVSAAPATVAPPAPAPVAAAPASPLRFVSNLDLECFRTDSYVPPPVTLLTRHINPVLANLPEERVTLGPREQLCVPVAKNNIIPPSDVLDFIRFVDLSCYRIEGAPVFFPLRLTHLNRVLADVPVRSVRLLHPDQLCVPVVKNEHVPPPEVLRFVSHIDLKCYVEDPPIALSRGLALTHLNRVLSGLPPHRVVVNENKRLCVPVQKNDEVIPPEVLRVVQFIDLEKYNITAAPLPTPFRLTLTHINPELADLPPEPAQLFVADQLALPVAKNNLIPPP